MLIQIFVITLWLSNQFAVDSFRNFQSNRLLRSRYFSSVETTIVEEENVLNSLSETKKVVWKAAVKSSVKVDEIKRSLEAYLALPASDYSVLSADQVVRINDSQFKFVLGNLNFFGTKICPILYVDVNVFPELAKSEIVVSKAETIGSEIANQINGTFSIYAKNIVSSGRDKKDRKILISDTSLVIDAIVPKSRIPLSIIQSGGNFVIQSSLSLIVPTFVRILATDFKRWSAGNDSRSAIEGASLALD
mmetsp:Transcript_32319/g.44156  ORF Transcript_32319/g.44156 Transcript_32319/m.44156 type:complete len:248 (+) Transcript_32319:51-794(+)